MISAEAIQKVALEAGIEFTAFVETSAIQFREAFRQACEKNACGKYDTNWMGPPAVGSIKKLKTRVLRFKRGLLIQTVHPIAGTSDVKGMLAAAGEHRVVFGNFLERIRNQYPDDEFLPLDAGCCSICEKCAYQDKEPCRHPDKAVSSVEAYGMDVAALMKKAGIPYNHGKEAVGFVGLVLFDRTRSRT